MLSNIHENDLPGHPYDECGTYDYDVEVELRTDKTLDNEAIN